MKYWLQDLTKSDIIRMTLKSEYKAIDATASYRPTPRYFTDNQKRELTQQIQLQLDQFNPPLYPVGNPFGLPEKIDYNFNDLQYKYQSFSNTNVNKHKNDNNDNNGNNDNNANNDNDTDMVKTRGFVPIPPVPGGGFIHIPPVPGGGFVHIPPVPGGEAHGYKYKQTEISFS